MDLFKTYGGLTHDLLISKLEAYGLDIPCLSLLKNYVTNCKKRAKVVSFDSDCFEFIREIPRD